MFHVIVHLSTGERWLQYATTPSAALAMLRAANELMGTGKVHVEDGTGQIFTVRALQRLQDEEKALTPEPGRDPQSARTSQRTAPTRSGS